MDILRTGKFKPETYTRLTAILKTRLVTIKTAIDTIQTQDENITPIQQKTLKAYMMEVDKKRSDFDQNLQRAISYTDDDALTDEVLTADQTEIEDLYIYISSVIDLLQSTDSQHSDISGMSTEHTTGGNSHTTVRLPKFELHKFNGELSNWTTFINLFDTSIHFNKSLSNVNKFQYLLSVLSGEPLNLIRNLNLSDENYVIAYGLLRDRYQNDRQLQLMHLNQILDLPEMSHHHVTGIRHFINKYQENTQALRAIQCDMPDVNPLLSAIILRKMNMELRKRLEMSRSTTYSIKHTLPTIKEILDFLNQECIQHENATLPLVTGTQLKNLPLTPTPPKLTNRISFPKRTLTMFSTQSTTPSGSKTHYTCAGCNETSHKTYKCPIFLAKTPYERFQMVKASHHCISCLGTHDLKTCKSQSTCQTCHKRHNTLLHFNDTRPENSTHLVKTNEHTAKYNSSDISSNSQKNVDTSVTLSSQNHQPQLTKGKMVLLGTVMLNLRTSNGVIHTFRALLDSGSMCTLITEHAVRLLNARRHRCDIQISGISQQMTRNKGQIFVTLETLSGRHIIADHAMIILDKLTVDLPRMPVSPDVVQYTQQYNLADPAYHWPNKVDIILGASLFPYIFTGRPISLGHDMPHIIDSQLGYVVMGTTPCIPQPLSSNSAHTSTLNVCLHSSNDTDIHNAIQRFWIQEEPPTCSMQSQEDILCEQHFVKTHSRDETGRFTVRLPFKDSNHALGKSRGGAELRLRSLERKFTIHKPFSTLYHEFMDDYLSLGHMTKCDESSIPDSHYFLPHHGVLKELNSTTKIRTVFDASYKTSSGFSLNDILLTGQKLQTNIADLLVNFRRYNVVFCCDIRQMYRQINLHTDDRNFQLILWRQNNSQPINVYRLNTVTYGMNSSPYLAIRTLHQLADDDGHEFPKAAHALLNHTYVDDIITGADTVEEAIDLQKELNALLKRGCFELRKWVSNSSQLLSNIPDAHLESPTFLPNSHEPHYTVLGLHWSPATDTFSYTARLPEITHNHTKRTVLSTIASIYDPCGFLTPFIMLAKCFMQQIWAQGLTWDEHLPKNIETQWILLLTDSQCLSQITIPRTFNLNSPNKIELHGFCDASENGYAAVIYLRCEQPNGTTTISLILGKSRVAPLKRVTIPRLELCAAHLLAQLMAHCMSLFPTNVTFKNIHLWSDSTVALTWLRTPPYRLKTYIANRVSQAQELIPTEAWNHISSNDNPADCASRGQLLSHLIHHSIWWNGPSWLTLPSKEWPTTKFTPVTLDTSHEIKVNPLTVLVTNHCEEWPLLSKLTSWISLQRIMAFVLRFIHNCKHTSLRHGNLTPKELHEAQLKIFFLLQQSTFPKEIIALNNNQCPKNLLTLSPFIDEDHLIRVGGRLRNTSLPHNAKHPVLLPKRHHIVDLLIDYYHTHHLHAGPQLVQSLLSQQVWILNARNTIRVRLHKCVTCFKNRPINKNPFMADLPSVRVNPSKPFTSTGIDYGGPYNVKITDLRFIKHIKVYLCVFICMVTKAVHIEVVTDLTTDAFIAALSRFISRRGICQNIYSDCGTNFIGANSVLRKLIQSVLSPKDSKQRIQHFSTSLSIHFHFNPPASPHHGGLWESAIKSAKYHLNRVMGNTVLTLPEFITLTTQIEAMLNSRPLTPLSSDPSDLMVLTPGHFLTGGPLASLPEQDFTHTPSNRLKHWHLVQQLHQQIWKRWSLEYLHTIQQRLKWNVKSPNLKIGDLVIVKTDSSSLSWPLARIIETFPGSDGTIRVVKIKTKDGIYVRPATKLFPLPID